MHCSWCLDKNFVIRGGKIHETLAAFHVTYGRVEYSGLKIPRRGHFGMDVSVRTFRRGRFGADASARAFRRGRFGADDSARRFRRAFRKKT